MNAGGLRKTGRLRRCIKTIWRREIGGGTEGAARLVLRKVFLGLHRRERGSEKRPGYN